jgi:IS6 family transposase
VNEDRGILHLCAVRWYLRYALSYRDVEELLRERGISVDHTTVFRWVQHYAPELDKRCRPQLKVTNDSYRVDETYIRSKSPGITSTALSTRRVRRWTSC